MDKKIYEDENRLISERRDKLQTIREKTNIPFPNNFKPLELTFSINSIDSSILFIKLQIIGK